MGTSKRPNAKPDSRRASSRQAVVEPPPNQSEPINWEKASTSFNRLLRVHKDEFKRLSNAETYREYEHD